MPSAATHQQPGNDHAVEILHWLNLEFVRSVQECDVAWLAEKLAPDFMSSNPDGSLVDRTGFLAQIGRGPGATNIAVHDIAVRIVGDLGIVRARTAIRTRSGAVRSGRYNDIWAHR